MRSHTTWSSIYAELATSDTPAVVTHASTWSFGELTARGAAAASWLDEIGALPGRPFAAVVSTTPAAYALTIGAIGSHRVIAPIGARLTAAEIGATLGPLGPSVVVAEPGSEAVARAAAEPLGLRVFVHPDFEPSTRVLDFAADPSDLAGIIHTSGTSGVPKPVSYAHGRLVSRTAVNGGLLGLGPGSIYAAASPFHHIAGLGSLFVALGSGAAVSPVPRFTADVWDDVMALGVTCAQLVPSMVEDLLDSGRLTAGRLRLLQYGASRIDPGTLRRLLDALPGVDLLQMYGQTEGSPITQLSPAEHRRAAVDAPHLLRTAGRAVDGVEIVVNEPDAAGIGEVWARAEHFMKPGDDGWLRTGDLGCFDPDGYLTLSGRKGDMIIRGGENVYPEQIEEVLRRHPRVADVAVVGDPDRRLGQRITAHVVARDKHEPPSTEELRTFARDVLAGFKVPERWEFHETLPRNAAGKILRRLLVETTE